MDDSIHERGRAIEDLFFQQKDQQLLEKLRSEMAADKSRASLEQASGIHDPVVLNALLANGITPETLLSVGLIPLVVVAWADEVIEEAEKNAILQAADIAGIKIGTAAHETLEFWLKSRPPTSLLESWMAYVHALHRSLEPASMQQLKSQVLQRAEGVAKSAGGFLGLGSKISNAERSVLDELEKAFG